LYRDTNFRWLCGGGALSMLGDQFTLIALPWLVLHLTNDSLALGATLAAIGLPRAMLVLFGGALVDRYSPRRILLLSKCCSASLTCLLALAAMHGAPDVRLVYLLAFGLGLSSALGFPASAALLPHIVPSHHLGKANALLMGMSQVAALLGPLGAGLIISVLGPHTRAPLDGVGIALLLDALSFIVSALTLSRIVMPDGAPQADPVDRARHLFGQIAYAFRYFWADRSLRACCVYWSVIAFCVGGPIQVGMPVLAMTNLAQGAAALGMIVSAHGAGALAGMAGAQFVPRAHNGRLGTAILVIDFAIGILFVALGFSHQAWHAATLLFLIGACNGFIQIRIYTWVQRRIPRELLGRAMSLFMFMLMSVAPLSVMLSGWALRILSAEKLFAICGTALMGVALLVRCLTKVTDISDAAPAPPQGVTAHAPVE
jgi:MFS family permease